MYATCMLHVIYVYVTCILPASLLPQCLHFLFSQLQMVVMTISPAISIMISDDNDYNCLLLHTG